MYLMTPMLSIDVSVFQSQFACYLFPLLLLVQMRGRPADVAEEEKEEEEEEEEEDEEDEA